jgi:hypothetical protein
MGHIGIFTPWKLVIGILFSGAGQPPSLKNRLEAEFGPLDYESLILPFTFTNYYQEEMGAVIFRRFISFRNLVQPESLADIKILTNKIEEDYIDASPPGDSAMIVKPQNCGGRKVNLDPGLLSLSRFILASTKDNSHRIPLAQGIYAELTLRFSKKDFQVLPWTYPDYATREYRDILKEIRGIFKDNLNQNDIFC